MTTLENLQHKRDTALSAYTAVLKASRLSGRFNMAKITQASNASDSAFWAWSTAYDTSLHTGATHK